MINYAIGRYWNKNESDSIAVYCYHTEVNYGSIEEAQEFLSYVKLQRPKEDWKIFILTEFNAPVE